MPEQIGLIKIKGEMDNYIFYTTPHGHLVRRRGHVSRERRLKGPEYAKSRNSSAEHGYASRMGKLLRKGVREIRMEKEPGDTNTRLVAAIRQVMTLDKANPQGERTITSETAAKLRGFEWNVEAPVSLTLMARYDLCIDRENGRVSFGIEGFDVGRMVQEYPGVTHVDLVLGVTAVDYEGDWQVSNYDGAGALCVAGAKPIDLMLECDMPGGEGDLIVAGLGIQMYQEINGQMNRMRTGAGYVVLDAVM